MSFILDALKKSESERQRQAGPALMEVRIAPPRSRLPLWAVLVGGLLLVNILVLCAVLVFRERPAPAAPAAAATSMPAPAPAPAPAATVAAPVSNAPPLVAPLPVPAGALPQSAGEPGGGVPLNPADYVPALPAGSLAAAPIAPQGPSAAEDAGLPTRDDLIAANQPVPEVRLSLHVFDPSPANRYVLINSTRLREGDSMADGMRLERITEGGVVLSWRGNRFRLRQGD